MDKRREQRTRAGRHNAAQTRPPELERSEQDEPQLPSAGRIGGDAATPVGAQRADRRPDEPAIMVDPALTDLGDDADRDLDDSDAARAPSRGRLEGGIDAGLTDLGDDVSRGVGDEAASAPRGRLEGGIDPGLTDLGDDVYRPAEIDEDDRRD